MPEETSFGRWLKARRKALDLTQEALSERVGCAVDTIRRYEADRLRPSRATAERLADHLELDNQERAAFVHQARSTGTPAAAAHSAHGTATVAPTARRPGQPLNLPTPLTALIGRAAETAAVCALFERTDIRLVTLVGPPGIGKTRLSLQVATDLAERYTDGVTFVALAPITDATLVVPTMAQALGVHARGKQPLMEHLTTTLRDKQLLVVLDNFEHVIEAAPHVATLLQAAPGLKVLTTSRMPLHLYGEHEYPVPPLTLPRKQPAVADDVMDYEAVRLFVLRAQAVRPEFAVTAANAAAIVELCRRLDGLPLAIELAAAHVKVESPVRLLERLGNRLDLLVDGARDQSPRQQTLRNAIAWSYSLLAPADQRFFAQLGVFAGSWSADGAAAICDGDIAGLRSLLDASLISVVSGDEDAPRFTMLETVGDYARERLTEHGDLDTLRHRHARYYRALAEQAGAELSSPHQLAWVRRLEREHPNLRAALDWLLTHDQADTALHLAAALWLFWYTRGYVREGRSWLERAVTLSTPAISAPRAKALNAIGFLALFEEEYAAAKRVLNESLAAYRQLDDIEGIASVLTNLGFVAVLGLQDLDQVPVLLAEVMALRPQLTDRRVIASLDVFAGGAAVIAGDLAGAIERMGDGLALYRVLGDLQGQNVCASNMGLLLVAVSDFDQAADRLRECLPLAQQLNDMQPLQYALVGLACVAAHRGDLARAVRLWGAEEALRDATGILLTPFIRGLLSYDDVRLGVSRQLGEAAVAAAWAEGNTMTLDQAVNYALDAPEATDDGRPDT